MENHIDEVKRRTMWIIWGSMLSGVVIYAVAGGFLAKQGGIDTMNAETLDMLLLVLSMISVSMTGAVLLAGGLLAKLPYTSYQIVRWALAESIAVYGLVLHIMGSGIATLIGFVAWSVVLMILLAPTRSAEDKYLELHTN